MRKFLVLDVDDVLLDFAAAFVRKVKEVRPDLTQCVKEDYLGEHWGFTEIDQLAGKSGFAASCVGAVIDEANLEEIKGMRQIVWEAQQLGWQVHLITNYPAHLFEARSKNLVREGFMNCNLHLTKVFNPKGEAVSIPKWKMARANGVGTMMYDRVLFVDDYARNVLDFVNNVKKRLPISEVTGVTFGRPINDAELKTEHEGLVVIKGSGPQDKYGQIAALQQFLTKEIRR